MNKACFYDRDGIINEMIYDKVLGIIHTPLRSSQVVLNFGITEALKHTKKLGYKNIIISNQPNIALNRTTLKTHRDIEKKIFFLLGTKKLIDSEYFCFHYPFGKVPELTKKCTCRKPGIGMFLKAKEDLDIDLHNSWMIGDGAYDIVAGHNAGCKTIWVSNFVEAGYLRVIKKIWGDILPTAMVQNVGEISKIITT